MAQYIDKSALVAEIERRFLEDYNTDDVEMDEVAQGVLASLKYFIDTLEVKEINSTNAFIEKDCAYLDSIGHRYIIDAFRKYMEKE